MKTMPETRAICQSFQLRVRCQRRSSARAGTMIRMGNLAGTRCVTGIEDRAELGLRREERKDEDLGDEDSRVDGGGGGGGPAEARGLREGGEDDRHGDGDGDVGERAGAARCPRCTPAGRTSGRRRRGRRGRGRASAACEKLGASAARRRGSSRQGSGTACRSETARMPRISSVCGGQTILTSRP